MTSKEWLLKQFWEDWWSPGNPYLLNVHCITLKSLASVDERVKMQTRQSFSWNRPREVHCHAFRFHTAANLYGTITRQVRHDVQVWLQQLKKVLNWLPFPIMHLWSWIIFIDFSQNNPSQRIESRSRWDHQAAFCSTRYSRPVDTPPLPSVLVTDLQRNRTDSMNICSLLAWPTGCGLCGSSDGCLLSERATIW